MSDDIRNVRPDGKTTGFTMSWIFWLIGIVVLIGAVVGTINFVGGWASQPARIYGVENVREQWRFAYEYNESLSAIQDQYCTASRAVADSVDAEERSQRSSQRIAIENNYNRVKAQYDARLRNAFEAGLVAPADVPRRAPELSTTCSSSG